MDEDRRAVDAALVGYGCRLPGAPDVAALWSLLEGGRCAVGPIPETRWSRRSLWHPDRRAIGTTYSAVAGLLDNPFAFDAGLFGIAPREAAQMDPQQRLLLEVAWEAIEMAGLVPAQLAGPRTGVFVGASGLDYGNTLAGDPAAVDARFMTGNTLSILANRVAHVLDAQGPSYVIDTACSSALFAFHAARQAIAAGEIDVAIVGGVNLLLTPMPFVGFSRAAMLSPSGLCRPFDHRADGYVRAEGAVAVVLAGRAWAEAAGLRPRSIVVGSAINSDGGANALSVPNADRQARLLERVYAEAGVDPAQVAFIEAHGTGTAVGDPQEATAIGSALGQHRDRPLPVGSIKSNIGHLEPAAGLAGLLKAQLALEHGVLPPTLHIEALNPDIDFQGLNIAPAVEPVVLEGNGLPLVAGVNAFGFGGANAHLAIRQPDPMPAAPAAPAEAPLILSAASEEALKVLAQRWRDRLGCAEPGEAAALVNAAAYRRARLARRLVVAATDAADRDAALAAFVAGREGDWVTEAAAGAAARPVAFVFSGNGAQWPGMGRTAYATDPVFRAGFEACAAAVTAEGGVDLVTALHDPDLEAQLGLAEVAQPLLLALQVGLVEALAAHGVRPAMVAGHSVGEVAAAWACGALTLAQAAQLAVRRARAQAPLLGTGSMAAVLASADAVAELIAGLGRDDLGIAADNSPRGATVSGSAEGIEALAAAAKARRIAVRRLRVDYPFHGPLMERIRDDLHTALADLRPGTARLPFVSTALGQVRQGETLDGGYWWLNARNPVRFQQAVAALADLGAGVFVEIGPQPTLQHYVADTLAAIGKQGRCLPGFRRQGHSAETVALIAARVLAAGGAVDEAAVFGPPLPLRHDLPANPWVRRDYAFTPTNDAINAMRHPARHPLLGWRAAEGEGPWRLVLDTAAQPWLADHAVDGAAVLPAAALVELALAAGAEALGEGPLELVDFDILRPVSLDGVRVDVRTHGPEDGVLRIDTRPHLGDHPWTTHAQGVVRRALVAVPSAAAPADPAEAADADLYAALASRGLRYGPAFARIGAIAADSDGVLTARLTAAAVPGSGDFRLDPTALDAAFHLMAPLLAAGGVDPETCYVPVRLGHLVVHRPGVAPARVTARLVRQGARSAEAIFTLFDAKGAPVALATGVRFVALRLGRRAEAVPMFWREEIRRMRAGPELPADLPREWADPAAALVGAGLALAEEPEPDAATLILDAACRRIAWETARSLAPRGGVAFRARRALPKGLAAALGPGLDALTEDGSYDPAADAVAEAAPVPSLSALVDALLTTAPDQVARLAAVLRLAKAFETRGEIARGATVAANGAADLLIDIAQTLCSGLHPTAAVDIALVGLEHAAPPPVRVAGGRIEVLPAGAGPAWQAACARGTFAAVLMPVDGPPDPATLRQLVRGLAPGGLLFAVGTVPDLPDLMLRTAVTGSVASPTDWADVARSAGLQDAAVLAATRPGLRIMVGHRPVQESDAVADSGAAAALPDTAIIFADSGGIGLSAAVGLQEALSAGGTHARVVLSADEVEAGDTVVLMAGCYARDGSAVETLTARHERLRALLATGRPSRVIVPIITVDARSRPADAAFMGMVRVLANEQARVSLRTVVVEAESVVEAARQLAHGILGHGDEPVLALNARGIEAPRVAAATDIVPRAAQRRFRDSVGHALQVPKAGGLDALSWVPVGRRAPGPGEVEVAIAAAGLNFRDLMWALELLPEEAIESGFSGAGLGMECAGTVVRAGPGARWPEGTRVMGFAAGALGTHVTVPDGFVTPIPAAMGFAEAATLPVAAATALHGLRELGHLRRGETVLIHGGAGGVGLAALQIARGLGARVLATAGAPEKRLLLSLLGADAVFDSRSLDFADGVMTATQGRGVDVALNILSGEAMRRTLECMAPFGRFVELGKRDFYANTRVGLRPLRRNVGFFGVDLDALLAARPESAAPLLEALSAALERGELTPLPHCVLPATAAVEAFRLMQRAGHIGKIVLTPPMVETRAAPAPSPLARPDRSWLIVGGTGGFGLALAERLALRGAGALWLTSRSGQVKDAGRLAAIRAGGTRVEVVACDVTDEAAMRALIARIGAEGPPLGGIAHAAMVLDDALHGDVDSARLAASVRPKLTGALLLDRLTRDAPLEHCLLFSSVAALFGNPGQSAYVAGNAALEAIARARRAAGRPALAVQWGPIADVGVLADDAATQARLAARGAGLMTATQALDALETALAGRRAQDAVLCIAPMRWGQLAPDLPLLATPLFEQVPRDAAPDRAAAQADLRTALAGLDDTQAQRRLIELFRAEAAAILRLDPADIDPARPMADLGFDSLMAVELKLSAEEKHGIVLPVFALAEGATITALAARVLADLRQGDGRDTETDEVAEALIARHAAAGQTAIAARLRDQGQTP